jgi:hypothetical protein
MSFIEWIQNTVNLSGFRHSAKELFNHSVIQMYIVQLYICTNAQMEFDFSLLPFILRKQIFMSVSIGNSMFKIIVEGEVLSR